MQIVDKLLEPYTITSDKQGGFVVNETVKRHNKKTGETLDTLKPVGYLISVKSAVQFTIQKKLANKEATYTLQQFLAEYKALEQEISKSLSIL
jgi:hypothetical protein